MEENQKGGFTAPASVKAGNAEAPKFAGQVTKKSTSKEALNSVKSTKRDVKVVAMTKGWFDCKRIEPGMKFMVSDSEFSEKWMEKI